MSDDDKVGDDTMSNDTTGDDTATGKGAVTVLPPDSAIDADDLEMERVAFQAGRTGNVYAIHVWTWLREQRRRRVALDLPPLETRADVEKAQLAVVAAAMRGQVTPRDGLDISTMLENCRRALAIREMEGRLRTLEKVNAEQVARGSRQ